MVGRRRALRRALLRAATFYLQKIYFETRPSKIVRQARASCSLTRSPITLSGQTARISSPYRDLPAARTY